MKKILLIALFLISLNAAGQAIHNQGVQIKSMTPAAAADTVYVAIDVDGNVRSISKEQLQNRLLNVHFEISSAYTTSLEHNHGKGKVTAGSINLDATGLPIGYEVRILNESALSIPISLEPGQAITLGQSVKSLESGYYAYAEVVDVDTWSVIIPPISAAAPPGSIGGTISGQYQVPYGSAVAGELVSNAALTFDGLNLSVGGSVMVGDDLGLTTATYGMYDGFSIYGPSSDIRAAFTSTNNDIHGIAPTKTNGVHTSILSHQGDLVLGVAEGGREVKVAQDPISTYGIGNLGFNDNRYLQEADFSNYGLLTSTNTWQWKNSFDGGLTSGNPDVVHGFTDSNFWNSSPSSRVGVAIGGTYANVSYAALRLFNTAYTDGSGARLGFGNNWQRNSDIATISSEIYGAVYNAGVVTATESRLVYRVASNSYFGNTLVATMTKDGVDVEGKVTAATLNLSGLPTYADDAAAGTGGLVSGDVYRTATGELRIKL